MYRRILALVATGLLVSSVDADSITLFGQRYDVRRFDYRAQITWPNPVSPSNSLGLLRVEGSWYLGGQRFLVSTSHQDQSVPTTYANFLLEIEADLDVEQRVTGFHYVRTVVQNDPTLLGSPFDLRAGGVAVNGAATGLGAGGNVLVADGGSNDILRAYDWNTGALLPIGPGGVGLPLVPPQTEVTDVVVVLDGGAGHERIHVLDETALRLFEYALDGTPVASFPVGGAANPLVAPADPKGLAYIPDVPTAAPLFRGQGGVFLVSMGDQRSGLQAFRRDGVELGWEPIDNTVFHTSSASIQPKIEGLAVDPVSGRLFLFMEKGSLVDNWVWVLTPDCNENGLLDGQDIAAGTESDLDVDGLPDSCSAQGVVFCSGDGVDPAVTTDCPCSNFGIARRGCANSVTSSGASLTVTGTTAGDSIVLHGLHMPSSAACIYLQGTTLTDTPFGDGIRCTGGTLLRLRTVINVSGASAFPDSSETITLAQRGGTVPGSGDTRYYQAYYRNAAAAFCPPETFNATNGWRTTW